MKLWEQHHVKLNEIEDYYNYLYQCWNARYSIVKELQAEAKMLNAHLNSLKEMFVNVIKRL